MEDPKRAQGAWEGVTGKNVKSWSGPKGLEPTPRKDSDMKANSGYARSSFGMGRYLRIGAEVRYRDYHQHHHYQLV